MSDKMKRLENLLTERYTVAQRLEQAEEMYKRIKDGASTVIQCAAVPTAVKPDDYTDEQWVEVGSKMAFIQVDAGDLGDLVLSSLNELTATLRAIDERIEELNI